MLLILKAGDTSSDSVVLQNNVVNTEKTEETVKERPSKKNKKKEKEKDKENIERPSIRSYVKKRLLVLPMEASLMAIFLLVLLVAFYVVCAYVIMCFSISSSIFSLWL